MTGVLLIVAAIILQGFVLLFGVMCGQAISEKDRGAARIHLFLGVVLVIAASALLIAAGAAWS